MALLQLQQRSAAAAARPMGSTAKMLLPSLARPARAGTAVAAAQKAEICTGDWRATKMEATARAFFDRVWTRGDVDLLDDLLASDFVWKDLVWLPNRPIVGPTAFKKFVSDMRQAYPDLSFEVGQVGVCDSQHCFVHYTCQGTNLRPTTDGAGQQHKPTFHESHISGIDLLTFNEDRTRLQEVVIYRQPTMEEKEFLEEEALAQDRLAIRLERLHFDTGSRSR